MGKNIEENEGPFSIVDRLWDLEEMVMGTAVLKADPGLFTLVLAEEGTVHMRVDCNRANGPYTLRGNSLSFGLLGITMAYCGDDSLHDQVLRLIEHVHSFEIQDSKLTLISQGGKLIFITP